MKALIVIFCSSLASIMFAQKAIVKLEVDPKNVQAGDPINVTVKSNVQGELDVDFPSAFVQGYSVMSGMEQEVDYNTGKVITLYYHTQEGVIRKDGTYTIGPAYIRSGNKTYKSNTVTVTVKKLAPSCGMSGEICAKQLRQPAFGVIERSKSKIYEGEPLVLNAKIYARFYPTHFEDYQPYMPDGALEKHDLSSGVKLVAEEVRIKNVDLYSFTYDRSLVFPNQPGKLHVDPYKLILRSGFDGMPVVSSAAGVEVLPLPSNKPSSFIGMVGKLEMEADVDKKEIKKGDVVKVSVHLTGTGNLHNIDYPKLQLPAGITQYGDPKSSDEITFTANGAEGKIDLVYTLKVNKDGSFNLPDLKASYFDPKTAKYVTLSAKLGELEGQEIKQLKGNANSTGGSTTVLTQSNLKGNPTVSTTENWYKNPIVWTGGSLMLALLFLVGMRRKKQETNQQKYVNLEANKIVQQTPIQKPGLEKSHIEQQVNEAIRLQKEGQSLESAAIIEKLTNELLVQLSSRKADLTVESYNAKRQQLQAMRDKCVEVRYGIAEWQLNNFKQHFELFSNS